MSTDLDDFLSLEPLLIERYKAEVPAVAGKVYAAADLDGVTEASQPKPAIHVLYDGYSVEQSQPDAGRAIVLQRWSVVVVVRNVRSSGDRARAEGGAILRRVLDVTLGWKPSPEHGALGLAPAAYRTTYRAGAAYLPLTFTTKTRIQGKS